MNNELKTFAITTLGCKVNQYESQQIRQLLENSGLTAARIDCRTGSRCRQYLLRYAHCLGKKPTIRQQSPQTQPAAAIVVRGCLPTAQTGELNKIDDSIHLIGHNQDLQAELLRIITGQTAASNIDTNETISKPAIDY